MRLRITVRNDDMELRGYVDVDSLDNLNGFAAAMKDVGIVIASPAADDYNPFTPPAYDDDISVPPEWAGM